MAAGMFVAAEWGEMKATGASLASRPLLGGKGLTPARIVVGGLLVAGLIAAVAGDPYRGTKATVDTKELARLVDGKADHILAEDLADRLIAGRNDFRIVDLRDASAYAAYHIPGAENIPLATLGSAELRADEGYLLYSDGGIHGAQAWILLKAKGMPRVYSLYGGIDEWKDRVLYPALPDQPTAEQAADVAKRKLVSQHFGGKPRGGGADKPAEPQSLPAPPPPADAPAPNTPPKKKKKEGC
jgi:rhodanese-related sulfurtransferase